MAKNSSQLGVFNRPTNKEKQDREYALSEILIDFKGKNERIEDSKLITAMKKGHYSDYDRNKLYKDKKALNQRNSFIRDLTEANVSKFYEDIYARLDTLSSDAYNEYNILQGNKKSSGKERRAIGYYINHIAEMQDNLMKGPMMDVSNALATRKILKLSEDSAYLKNLLIKNGIDPESGEKKRYTNDVTNEKEKVTA